MRLLQYATVSVLLVAATCAAQLTWKHYSLHAVLSGSMGRAIPVGSLVLVRTADPLAYRVGDVVLFPDPSEPRTHIVHRIIAEHTTAQGVLFETRGDANPNGDGSVSGAQVLGLVVATVPLIGYVVHAVQVPAGYILFAAVSLVLIVLPAVVWLVPKKLHTSTIKIKSIV